MPRDSHRSCKFFSIAFGTILHRSHLKSLNKVAKQQPNAPRRDIVVYNCTLL